MLILGATAPFLIPTGVGSFDGDAAEVARAAYAAAWIHNDNPIGRLALPAARVRRVWREPGHCPPSEPGGSEPLAAWRAEVRYYPWFGIPGPTLHVRCGGWAW